MTSFIDSSALVKRYVEEPDSEFANSLAAVQLAAAQRLHVSNLTFITFDLRQANAARTLGFHVVGC